MLKYRFEEMLNRLSIKDREKAEKELPQVMKMTPKHFKYQIIEAKWDEGPSLYEWKLMNAKNWLRDNFPKRFEKLKIDDLINEPRRKTA